MILVTLRDVLQPALSGGYAVPGLVCLGWEDARAFALAAQAERAPVILQAGPGAQALLPVAVWGAILRDLAASVDVPVVAHLDHGGSGVPWAQRAALAATSRITKFNIGTELRMAFGTALRVAVNPVPSRFDQIAILGETHAAVFDAASAVLRNLGASGCA